jgi:putative SOS response-associated peptidase YedK
MKTSILYIIDTLKKYDIHLRPDFTDESQKTDNFPKSEKILSIFQNSSGYNLAITNLGIRYSKNSPCVFNSRLETIKTKPHWMDLFSKNRMLVPMSGFYEWKKDESQKIPYRIFIPGEELFFVAAVYYQDNNDDRFSALITTTPNSFIKPLHNRMPVIFNIPDGIKFLNSGSNSALNMCIPFQGDMKMEKVE